MSKSPRARALLRLWAGLLVACTVAAAAPAVAAPYAAVVQDARSGDILHARNHDARLHPASLTKMMTLYVTFEAVENGEISLDQQVTISRFAASEPPSRLGLRAGQKIAVRHLIRAAAVKSANDAATALGEAVAGSEEAFAARMNRTAAALGMTRTTFKNAHGLTQSGHLSTARDMTTLGRHLFYDYPEYYNLFSRPTTNAGGTTVRNTNRRLLSAYKGADGIKTGFTNAAGFNLVASAERGGERIIVTVFGGSSGAARNKRVAELLDMGFERAPTQVAVNRPARPTYAPDAGGAADRTVRLTGLVTQSVRPLPAPRGAPSTRIATSSSIMMRDAIEDGVTEAIIGPRSDADGAAGAGTDPGAPGPGGIRRLAPHFAGVLPQGAAASPDREEVDAILDAALLADDPAPLPVPAVMRPAVTDGITVPPQPVRAALVMRREDAVGPGTWGVRLGRRGTTYEARKDMVRAVLAEPAALGAAHRTILPVKGGHAAAIDGLGELAAQRACARLTGRGLTCEVVAP